MREPSASEEQPRPVVRQAPAFRDEVPALRRAAGAYAAEHGASPGAVADIALAVSEALTNIVVHAYLDASQPGPMTVSAGRLDGEIVVVVSDEGRGMVPRRDSPGLGLGLAIMARLASSVEVVDHQPGPGTTVRLRFALCAARDLESYEDAPTGW